MGWLARLVAAGLILAACGSALAAPAGGAGAEATAGVGAAALVGARAGAGAEAAAVVGGAGAEWVGGIGGGWRGGAVVSVPAGAFRWPVPDPAQVVRPFDLPEQPWLAGHRGVDLRAPAGSEVASPADGTVSFNAWIVDRHVLVIRHGDLASTLEPVVSDLAVGERVGRGDIVGLVATGEAWHCEECLHWGVRRGDQYLDPALLVNPQPRAVLWR